MAYPSSTTGGIEPSYKATGQEDVVKKLSHFIFTDVCGIPNVEHVLLYAAGRVDDETRKKYLEQVYNLGKEF
jgi:putative NADPH-quinone reductase